jgi:hypothetical protein
MPGDSNTPHNVENYTIGKGILYVANFPGAGVPSWTEIGNCPSIELEQSIERLPHYSSRSGLRVKDKNPVVQTDYMVNFDCDEIAAENLKIYLMATQTGNTLHGMQDPNKEYALKFVSDNPIGPNQSWYFWKCNIGPNGALSLIGEEWMVMSYSAEGLADSTNHATSPYFDCVPVTTTTTTTTTTSTTTTAP